MKYLTIPIAAFLMLCLTACGGNAQGGDAHGHSDGETETTVVSKIETVGPEAFNDMLVGVESPQLIDVRTPGEVAEGKLEGSVNMDWNGDEFESQIKTLDTSQPVYVYCAMGGRSAKAAKKMAELGFPKVVDMSGGYTEWSAKGMKTVQ